MIARLLVCRVKNMNPNNALLAVELLPRSRRPNIRSRDGAGYLEDRRDGPCS